MLVTKLAKLKMSRDRNSVIKYLNIAQGQIEGILKMIEDDRYCLDISDQLRATRAILKKANNQILKSHIDECVKDAITKGDNEKIDEVIKALEKQI